MNSARKQPRRKIIIRQKQLMEPTIETNDQLIAYCDNIAKNGVEQHSEQWIQLRKVLIGGSSIATVLGLNPYQTLRHMILVKVGIVPFGGDEKTQWGNLFEEVIKQCVQIDKKTTVYGENLYITGSSVSPKFADCCYSPDGLALLGGIGTIEQREVWENGVCVREELVAIPGKPVCALVEFKCPYSRIPRSFVPQYYIPQVKMGMELIPAAQVGLFCEGVFRRCGWDQYNTSGDFDKTLSPTCLGKSPRMFGLIGWYVTSDQMDSMDISMIVEYNDYFSEAMGTMEINDLGSCSPDLFKRLLALVDCGRISVWYSPCESDTDNAAKYLAEFTTLATTNGNRPIGLIPWKLFALNYHWITKEPGFLDSSIGLLRKCIECVEKCWQVDERHRMNIVDQYFPALE